MEENLNGGQENHEERRDYAAEGPKTGYSSEGRKLRPRKKVVPAASSSADGEYKSYDNHRSYSSDNRGGYGQRGGYQSRGGNSRGGYSSDRRSSYGDRSGGYGQRRSYGDNAEGGERRSSSYGQSRPSYGDRPSYGQRRSYGSNNYDGGDVLPMDAALTGVNNVAVRSGNSFQMTGRILNLSAEKITKVRVAYSVNGEEEKFADIEQTIGERSEAEITVDHDAIFGTEPVSYTMRLVSVNGEADAFAGNNSQSAYVLFPNTEAVKRVVMEEFTGIKCGYCPRGIVGIRTCHERFGDKFIAIAKHCYSGTPTELQASTYNYNISGGFPKCIIDRRYQCDPGPTKAPPYVSAQLGAGCSAGVDLEAVFPEDGDGSQIDVCATAQFLSSYSNSQFRFAFAILEDSVKGYTQANNYYGSSAQMGGFEKLPSHAAINLDHVARAGFGVLNGIENSIPANVDEFHTVTYATKLDIPTNVQSKDYLRVVVLLLDTSTGRIDNAAEVAYVKTGSLSAIRDLKADSPAPDVEIRNGKVVADGFAGTIQVYSVNGMRLANESLAHGIYIVRLTNGKQTFVKRIAY